MTALTEFLLARIAADAEAAKDAEEDGVHTFPHSPRRLLADCEAKRRIVERCKWIVEHPQWANDMELAERFEDAETTLYDLAAIHADHPDYREEWKP